MPNENQIIKAELRFSGEDELKIIREELALSGAKNIAVYDGVVEAELPLSSVEILKNKHILIDFPYQKELPVMENLELFNIPIMAPEKKRNAAESEWIEGFKKKADRSYIDKHTNRLTTNTKATKHGEDNQDDILVPVPKAESGDLETISLPAPESDGEPTINQEDLYLVNFKGPMNSAYRTQFTDHAITLTSFHDGENEYSYSAFLTKEQYEYLAGQDITASMHKYDMERKLSDSIVQKLSQPDSDFESLVTDITFDIVLSDEKYLEKITETITTSEQATIIDSGLNIIRIKTNPKSELFAALANSPCVSSIALYEPPTLFCDVCRQSVGLEFSNPANGFLGESETVGVIDSGIDDTHPDLKNRIKAALQFGEGIKLDQVGHGTHVAGIICGDGTASNGKITGMAPKAQVVSVGIVTTSGELDLPVDIGRLLKIAADNGAKIINLSLGKKVSGDYHLGSFSVDKYVYENPEILVVVAAGNDGNAIQGRLAYKTVGAPATAKNVLTVGAASSRRTTPVINQTWGNVKPAGFPLPPLNGTKLISTEDHPSLGSSTGPTDFESIKPEVVAPGTFILAAKSKFSTIQTSSSEFFDNNYTFKTGTSMATPVVSGLAAVLREYLRIVHHCPNPSSALIKAIIIGNSHQIQSYRTPPADVSLDKIGFPDFDQGFGLVDMGKLLKERSIQLSYIDIYNTDPKALESRAALGGPVKSMREYTVEITENTGDLSVTLTWIDPPAKGIQNNLQLSVKPPSNEWKLGNMEHNYKKDELFDTVFDLKPLDKYNNTEKILIKNPSVGKYLIRITAQNTLSRQGYSLAILGNISNFIER